MDIKQIEKSLDYLSSNLTGSEVENAIDLLKSKLDLLPTKKNTKNSLTKNIHDASSLVLPEMCQEYSNMLALFTDGACRGNPGPGAWAAIGQSEDNQILFQSSGVEISTTNNKMELMAVIEALKWSFENISENISAILIFSDSKYVVQGINSWVVGWKKRGWRKADNKEPENLQLWQELDMLTESLKKRFFIKFYWVKGHSGHPQNEYCDSLANQALDEVGY